MKKNDADYTLGHVMAKLDSLHDEVKDFRVDMRDLKKDMNVRFISHDTRIRYIERKWWYLAGALAVIGIPLIAKAFIL